MTIDEAQSLIDFYIKCKIFTNDTLKMLIENII